VAYHWIDSKVRAYVYAEKAMRHFKETNNFLRAIDAEALTLTQDGSDIHLDFQEMIESYHNLIHASEILNAPDRKELLLSNLAYQYHKRNDYANAQKLLKEALKIVDKPSFLYLKCLHNYLKSSLDGKLLRKTEMLKKAQQGLAMAKELDIGLYKKLFKLLIYRIENKLEQYYGYIENDALPYFQSNKHTLMINRCAKELYNHYIEIEQYEKAARISKVFIDTVK
jgi:HTH-type transcriptional regulator, quorum sensing regulator NprR